MKRVVAVLVLAAALAAPAFAEEWTGWITDTHCGKNGATKDHTAACVEKCMKGGSKAQLFSEADNVVPDVVWVSNERLAALMDEAGHLTGAPELAVEVLSPGVENERRDREAKLKLYESRGVREYWIVDWRLQQIEVYRRERAMLHLVVTLFAEDVLTSPLLPGFSCPVARLFT